MGIKGGVSTTGILDFEERVTNERKQNINGHEKRSVRIDLPRPIQSPTTHPKERDKVKIAYDPNSPKSQSKEQELKGEEENQQQQPKNQKDQQEQKLKKQKRQQQPNNEMNFQKK